MHVKVRSIADLLPPAFDSNEEQPFGVGALSHFTRQQQEDGIKLDELKLKDDELARKYLFDAEEEVEAPSTIAGLSGQYLNPCSIEFRWQID